MENVISIIIGVVCIVIGILHTKGNISLLHSYHRKRVAEEDKVPFGKAVGLGVIIVGASLILVGTLHIISNVLLSGMLSVIANIVLGVGLVVGLGISLYAIIKYNKGLF